MLEGGKNYCRQLLTGPSFIVNGLSGPWVHVPMNILKSLRHKPYHLNLGKSVVYTSIAELRYCADIDVLEVLVCYREMQ